MLIFFLQQRGKVVDELVSVVATVLYALMKCDWEYTESYNFFTTRACISYEHKVVNYTFKAI